MREAANQACDCVGGRNEAQAGLAERAQEVRLLLRFCAPPSRGLGGPGGALVGGWGPELEGLRPAPLRRPLAPGLCVFTVGPSSFQSPTGIFECYRVFYTSSSPLLSCFSKLEERGMATAHEVCTRRGWTGADPTPTRPLPVRSVSPSCSARLLFGL